MELKGQHIFFFSFFGGLFFGGLFFRLDTALEGQRDTGRDLRIVKVVGGVSYQ
jgi:hypothetical protein